jgi:hypothetical protein
LSDFDFFKEASNNTLKDTFLIELNNILIDLHLYEYAIYVIHCVKGRKLYKPFDKMVETNFNLKLKNTDLYIRYKNSL